MTHSIPLGMNTMLRTRSAGQRTTVLNAVKAALDKGSNEVVARENLMWSDVQAAEGGAYVWTVPDAVVTACADAGVRTVFCIDHPPVWATAPGAGSVGYSWLCPPFADVLTDDDNSALDAYVALCLAAAQRYGPNGTFWSTYNGTDLPVTLVEIWNEPWVYCNRWDGGALTDAPADPAGYATIWSRVAAALHGVTQVKVSASVTDKVWPTAAPFFDIFLANISGRIDAVSVHPYPYGYEEASHIPPVADRWEYFTQVEDIHDKIVAAQLDDVSMWITEIGWPTTPSGGLTEAVQATRFTGLWSAVQDMDYVDGLVLFCATNPDAPDQVGMDGYNVANPECFLPLWHTGATPQDLGTAKPAVATVTGLSAITRPDSLPVTTFIKPTPQGNLPPSVEVSNASLPVTSRGTPLAVMMRPASADCYPVADLTSFTCTDTAPTYTGVQYFSYDSGRFRIGGQTSVLEGVPGLAWNRLNTGESGFGVTSCEYEMYIKGDRFAIELGAYGEHDYRVLVDDMPLVPAGSLGWQHLPAAGVYYVAVRFATSRTRRVRLFIGSTGFGKIMTPSDGDVWPAAPRFKVATLGDSMEHGTIDTPEGIISAGTINGCAAVLTGWEWWNMSMGGTGYSNAADADGDNPGPFGATPYGSATRLEALAALPAMDLILVCGGANDGDLVTFPLKTTIVNARKCWSDIHDLMPDTPIVVWGIESGVYPSANAELNALNDALKAAAESHPHVTAFIDQRNPMWISGTGNSAAPEGDGNADIFVSGAPDGVHPCHAGFQYTAERLVANLANVRI